MPRNRPVRVGSSSSCAEGAGASILRVGWEEFRQQMRDRAATENGAAVELPAWDALVDFAGLIVAAAEASLIETSLHTRRAFSSVSSGAGH